MADILAGLGRQYPERSVRRWLSELVAEKLVERSGAARATRYMILKPALVFSATAQQAINKVRGSMFSRTPVSYRFDWVDSYLPNQSFYLTEEKRKKLLLIGCRERGHVPAGTYARQIYNRLLIDLSYNSSRLEGNTYTPLETEKLLLQGISASSKLDEEKIMILNHKDAIRFLVENSSKLIVDFKEICTLHYLLADGLVTAKYAGKVRDHSVRIGSSAYLPIDSKVRLENQLQLVCNKASQINDPYEQSLFLLIQLSYLQAFTDVNKRTSRLAANIPLIKHNLVPLSFNDVSKEDYVSAMLAVYELNDVLPLTEIYEYSYRRAGQLYDATVVAVGYDEVRVRYRQQRRECVRYIVTHSLHGAAIESYLREQEARFVPEQHVSAFREDIYEDLQELSPQTSVGLGISETELSIWLKHDDKKKQIKK